MPTKLTAVFAGVAGVVPHDTTTAKEQGDMLRGQRIFFQFAFLYPTRNQQHRSRPP